MAQRTVAAVPPAIIDLNLPVEQFAHITARHATQLRRLGVTRLAELLEYFPRDYRQESEEKPIGNLVEGEIGIARGEVIAVNFVPGGARSRFEATLDDSTGALALVFFNGGYLQRKLHPGLTLRVRGKIFFYRGGNQMVNPRWDVVTDATPPIAEARLRPVYPAGGGLDSEAIERLVKANLPAALPAVREWFDAKWLSTRQLMRRPAAYSSIHQPATQREARNARRRLVYDELMLMQLALLLSRRLGGERIKAPILKIDRTLDQRITRRFPFELTDAQRNAAWQIAADLKCGRPMKRLLQGDVGSGKTVVALYAMLVTVANGMQAALLAPTEVLAEQHFLTLTGLLRGSRVKIELFTGRTRRQSRGKLIAELAAGKIHLAVGTQALLSEPVEFANLGLIVVDEQHRLGVLQRASLTGKGVCPHYLVMTATPIPRTLALSFLADFDLSTIDQLPPGRQPITTRWLRPHQSPEAYSLVREQIRAGRQAYVVVGRVTDDGLEDAKSVQRRLPELSAGPLAGLRLAGLHGQMPTDEKQKIMLDFRDGRIDVLVATTVIEVGIDVPNSTVMVIEGAEQFGLSQLHQLRGRVGRGQHPSHCILLSDAPTPGSESRLTAMTQTTSGFEIAEMDLKLRGPGEFFGTRQHGLPEFKLTDLTSELELLARARTDAEEILTADPRLTRGDHANLRAILIERFGRTLQLAQIG